MIDIYSIYLFFSSDNEQKQSQTPNLYCLSTSKLNVVIPVLKTSSLPHINDENRYNIRKFFKDDGFSFGLYSGYSFLDIQNNLSVKHMQDREKDLNIENSLILTYGGMSAKNELVSGLYWTKLVFNRETEGFTADKNLNLLIDYVIDRS